MSLSTANEDMDKIIDVIREELLGVGLLKEKMVYLDDVFESGWVKLKMGD